MRIQFILPNFGCPIGISIGVAILSTELKMAGHDASCIHINDDLGYPFDLERIRNDVEKYGPDLIAFSFGTNHLIESKEIARNLKEFYQIPILFGGIHTTLNAEEMISLDFVDMTCVGEGDKALVELVNAIEKGEDTTSIKNIWVKKDGKIFRNPIRPLVDVSDQPVMDTEIFDFQKITDLRNGWVNLVVGRGCPFRCNYCHNNGVVRLYRKQLHCAWKELNYIRRRSVENLINELKSLMQKYEIKAFSFNDDCFTYAKPWLLKFLKAYEDEVGLPFVCNTHALYMDEEIAKALGEANCDMVRFGVECGSEEIRREILGRKVPDKKVFDALRAVREAGMRTFTYNMMAIPSETRENMMSTLKLNAWLNPDGLRVSLAYPYPGTDLFHVGKKMDIIEEGIEYHDYLEKSKFRYPKEDKLFIDKTRMVYWWHINKYLKNGSSKIYEVLLDAVDRIPEETWFREDTQSTLLSIDKSVSALLTKSGITHYTARFPHRPDISILVRGEDFDSIQEELLDPH